MNVVTKIAITAWLLSSVAWVLFHRATRNSSIGVPLLRHKPSPLTKVQGCART